MLVLTRREGESIFIGNKEIIIKILKIERHEIKIGIEADKKWSVHREEVFYRIQNSNDKDKDNRGNE